MSYMATGQLFFNSLPFPPKIERYMQDVEINYDMYTCYCAGQC